MDWTVAGELVGFLLMAYGLIRQSFADLGAERPFGEGRFGEGAYAGRTSGPMTFVLRAATGVRMLPGDRALTLADRRRNAAMAIVGVLIAVISLAGELALTVASSPAVR